MKIALIGYGKMGKEIERLIIDAGQHEVVLKISSSNRDEFTIDNLKKVDVAIEFSKPELAFENVMKCFEANIPVVVGTTAWEEKQAIQFCKENNKALFTAPNFSIGVNLFFKLNKYLAQLMEKFPEYKLKMSEIHHTEKLDAPSGTAIHLANHIIENNTQYNNWELDSDEVENTIPIKAIREENVPGTHTIDYRSDIDEISINHVAFNREGFALGAIKAAEFMNGKVGYFTMNNLI